MARCADAKAWGSRWVWRRMQCDGKAGEGFFLAQRIHFKLGEHVLIGCTDQRFEHGQQWEKNTLATCA